MEQRCEVFVGIDVAKMRNAVAVADGERGGEVRYLGEIDAASESMRRLVKRLATKHAQPELNRPRRAAQRQALSLRTV